MNKFIFVKIQGMIIYCITVNINTDEDFYGIKQPYKIVDTKLSEVVIIAYKEVKINKLISHQNYIIISPKVTLCNSIDLSALHSIKYRSPNKDKDFYGLPGFPGDPGYNLCIITDILDMSNCIYISTGSPGSPGQSGNPPGRQGKGGKGGYLIVNNKIVCQGKDRNDNVLDEPFNSIGLLEPVHNNFGLNIDMEYYRYAINTGILELHLDNDSKICNFFRF